MSRAPEKTPSRSREGRERRKTRHRTTRDGSILPSSDQRAAGPLLSNVHDDDAFDVDDFFADADDSARQRDPLAADLPLRPFRVEPGAHAVDGGALQLPPDALELRYTRNEFWSEVHATAIVTNRCAAPVELKALHAVARDTNGELLDTDWAPVDLTVERQAEVLARFRFEMGVTDRLRSLELIAEHRIRFDVRVASGLTDELDLVRAAHHRERFPIRMEVAPPSPGMPRHDCALTGFVGYRHHSEVEVYVQLTERTPSIDRFRTVTLNLRDDSGRAIARDSSSATIPGPGLEVFTKESFDLGRPEIRRIRRIDVNVSGDCERTETLGIYPVSRGD